MKPTINVGVIEFFVIAAYIIIFTVLWRAAAARLAEHPIGRAMAAVYS